MTIFDFINACDMRWDVIRIFTDTEDTEEPKDLGSFFSFQEIPEELLQSEIDTWSVNTYNDGGETTCEITIII